MTTIAADLAAVAGELVAIENTLAEVAWWLTDPDRRDTLEWVGERGHRSTPTAVVFSARSIACRLSS